MKLKLILVAILAVMLTNCGETRRLEKAKEVLDRNELEAATYCATKFPVVPVEIYIPGKTVSDTVWQQYQDYVPFDCPPSDTVVRYKVQIQFKEKIISKVTVDTLKTKVVDSARTKMWEEMYKREVKSRLVSEKDAAKWKAIAKRRADTNSYLWLALIFIALVLTRKLWWPYIGGWFSKGASIVGKLFKLVR